MRFEEWEPHYLSIIKDFGYSRREDELSAGLVSRCLEKAKPCDESCLRSKIGEEVTVCGDSDLLEDHLRRLGMQGTVMAADGATKVLMGLGRVPDIIVTDLDGDVPSQLAANQAGAIAVIHAHGDNQAVIGSVVPRFEGLVVGTTQASPSAGILNFGGFTDGDRAVMLARHFGAKRILLLGFDFQHPREKQGRVLELKRRKLEWARHLIFDLNPPGVVLSIP